jgi:hypothetical protein
LDSGYEKTQFWEDAKKCRSHGCGAMIVCLQAWGVTNVVMKSGYGMVEYNYKLIFYLHPKVMIHVPSPHRKFNIYAG